MSFYFAIECIPQNAHVTILYLDTDKNQVTEEAIKRSTGKHYEIFEMHEDPSKTYQAMIRWFVELGVPSEEIISLCQMIFDKMEKGFAIARAKSQ